jgi:hypothetical protein
MNLRRLASTGGALVVAAIAALVWYSHMRSVAREYGQPELIAALLPISVDGMMAVATVALGDGRRHRFSAWLAFWIGVAASVLANVLAAEPSVIVWCISAWPAIAFVLVVEVITRGGRGSVEPATTDSGATGSPIARPKARPGATTHSAVVQPADAGTALQAAPTVSRRKSTKPVRRPISQTRQLAAGVHESAKIDIGRCIAGAQNSCAPASCSGRSCGVRVFVRWSRLGRRRLRWGFCH